MGIRLRWEDATTTDGKSVGPLEHERHFCKKCRTSIGPRKESDDIADYATDAKAVGKEVRTHHGFMTSLRKHLLSCSTRVCEVTTLCFHAHTDRHSRTCSCRSTRTCSCPWPFCYKISAEIFSSPTLPNPIVLFELTIFLCFLSARTRREIGRSSRL